MAHRRDPRAVRWLDLSKYAVLLLLAVALIVLLTTRSCQPQLTVLKPTPAATLAPTFTAEADPGAAGAGLPADRLHGDAWRRLRCSGEGARGYSIRVRDQAGKLACRHARPARRQLDNHGHYRRARRRHA
jgi:hypothetical protein